MIADPLPSLTHSLSCPLASHQPSWRILSSPIRGPCLAHSPRSAFYLLSRACLAFAVPPSCCPDPMPSTSTCPRLIKSQEKLFRVYRCHDFRRFQEEISFHKLTANNNHSAWEAMRPSICEMSNTKIALLIAFSSYLAFEKHTCF